MSYGCYDKLYTYFSFILSRILSIVPESFDCSLACWSVLKMFILLAVSLFSSCAGHKKKKCLVFTNILYHVPECATSISAHFNIVNMCVDSLHYSLYPSYCSCLHLVLICSFFYSVCACLLF